jgi:hypothetical protein
MQRMVDARGDSCSDRGEREDDLISGNCGHGKSSLTNGSFVSRQYAIKLGIS